MLIIFARVGTVISILSRNAPFGLRTNGRNLSIDIFTQNFKSFLLDLAELPHMCHLIYVREGVKSSIFKHIVGRLCSACLFFRPVVTSYPDAQIIGQSTIEPGGENHFQDSSYSRGNAAVAYLTL